MVTLRLFGTNDTSIGKFQPLQKVARSTVMLSNATANSTGVNKMVFYKFWIADGICEKQFIREAKELKTIDGTTYWHTPTGKRFEVWGVERV